MLTSLSCPSKVLFLLPSSSVVVALCTQYCPTLLLCKGKERAALVL